MRKTLVLIFFLSGASALIFEALWFRLAGLSLGNSVWSASLVLAAFMGGLALGNGLVARMHERLAHPLRIYAALEFAIGLGGIAVVLLLPQMSGLLGPLLGNLTDTPLLLNAVRLTIAFTILLIPAIAMGATLPVIVHALTRQNPNFGSNIGRLYGWNTLGATLGAFSAELVFVPILGVVSSGLVALVLNLTAAVIALRLSKDIESDATPAPAESQQSGPISGRSRRFLAVAFLSGALMLALEVVWFRFLLLTMPGTSLIFAIMLAVVLAGIALGGLIAAQWFERDDKAYRWIGHVTAVSAALVVLTYWGYDLFKVYLQLEMPTIQTFLGYAVFLMFPVALLSGVAFTMVNRAVKDDLGSSARTAGIATLFNTVGAMIGALLGGFVLLPMAGMELSFFIIAAMYLAVAFLVPRDNQTLRYTVSLGRGSIGLAIVCLVLFPFGLMQRTHFGAEVPWLPGHNLVATREGLVETVRYYQRAVYGEPKYYRLVTDTYSMSATTRAAKRYMKLYVYLPMALKSDARDALLISYGVGSTAKALTDSAGLQEIDVVDISRDILEMSSIVYPGDDNPLKDERVRVHVEDGRFFLNATTKGYDLITSEPPPPKIAGVVNLYSAEYFALIRSRLNPGGFTSYWLPVQQLMPTDTLAIIKAFCDAFEDCSLWSGAGLEWMLLGSNDAVAENDPARFAAQWNDPVVGPEMRSLGFESPEQLGSLFMADAAFLADLTADVRPVNDNHPSRISSHLVEDMGAFVELYGAMMDEGQRLQRFRDSELIARLWPDEFRSASEPYFEYERMLKNHFTAGLYQQASEPVVWANIERLLTESSLTTLPLWMLGSDSDTVAIVERLAGAGEHQEKFALEFARKYTSERDYLTALRFMESYVPAVPEVTEWESSLYLYLLAKNGMVARSKPIVDNLRTLGRPSVDRFLDWYEQEFDIHAVHEPDAMVLGAERIPDMALQQ